MFRLLTLYLFNDESSSDPLGTSIIQRNILMFLHECDLEFKTEEETSIYRISFKMLRNCMPLTKTVFVFRLEKTDAVKIFGCTRNDTLGVKFVTEEELISFQSAFSKVFYSNELQRIEQNGDCIGSSFEATLIPSKRKREAKSAFDERTEESSAQTYFQFYGLLSQQQNMMQDYSRTFTYQRAILENAVDFQDKIVVDVGAGSGILSFFAVQAGAKRVYAIEASSMADYCKELIRSNSLEHKIKVIPKKIEEVELPEEADIIISEPMGYMLVNERMLESYVYARKFLKKQGRMFPTKSEIRFGLFTDEALYLEQIQKCSFWYQNSFHGVDLTSLKAEATRETFSQPVVDTWHSNILISRTTKWVYNFEKDDVEALKNIEIPFDFVVLRTAFLHGVASWFDVAFCGSERRIWLSTAPSEPLTHWYQIRCMLQEPVLVKQGQKVGGHLKMIANNKQSYDIHLLIEVNGRTYSNTLDLKQPYFRYTAQGNQPPPGSFSENPSDQLDNMIGSSFSTDFFQQQQQQYQQYNENNFYAHQNQASNSNCKQYSNFSNGYKDASIQQERTLPHPRN